MDKQNKDKGIWKDLAILLFLVIVLIFIIYLCIMDIKNNPLCPDGTIWYDNSFDAKIELKEIFFKLNVRDCISMCNEQVWKYNGIVDNMSCWKKETCEEWCLEGNFN